MSKVTDILDRLLTPTDILCIDDDLDDVELFRKEAAQFNCSVTFAVDGKEGITRGLAKRWGVIFIDHSLPGTSGLEVFGLLRKQCHRIAIFSGVLTTELVRQYNEVGAFLFVTKSSAPHSIRQLLLTMGIALKEDIANSIVTVDSEKASSAVPDRLQQ